MRNREKPTPRQSEFLDAFRRLLKHNAGIAPSLEELAAEMGVKKATAQGFARDLLAKGLLFKGAGSYRCLTLKRLSGGSNGSNTAATR